MSTSSVKELNPELLHQIAAMRFDSPLRASELIRDLLVQSAARDAFENLTLTRSQAVHEPPQRLVLVVLLLAHAPACDRALDGDQQFLLPYRFRQKVFRARFDDLHRRRDITVTRQENDRQVRTHVIQASLQLGPAEPRDPDIEEDAAAAGIRGKLREQLLP